MEAQNPTGTGTPPVSGGVLEFSHDKERHIADASAGHHTPKYCPFPLELTND
ncbi:hypothetical protein ACFO7V_09200 [Glutamicibacter bergerei]|uniref:Uncharacterized protein n=1 Tax=Glutamicibacter bergerei TaxID=256702 RepID=A0ABV9MNC3_9MICC